MKKKSSQNKKSSVFTRLLKETRPYVGYLVISLIICTLQIAATLLAPVFIGKAVDYMVKVGAVDFTKIAQYILYLGICIIIVVITQYLVSCFTNRVSYGVIFNMRCRTFKKLNSLPLAYIDSSNFGDILSRISVDIDMISDGLIQGFTQVFSGLITIAGTLVFMMVINWKVALFVVVVTPLSLFVAYFISKTSHKTFLKQAKLRGQMSGLTEEMLSNQKIVKAFNYESTAQKRFEVIDCQLNKVGVSAMFMSAMINPLTRFVNGLVYAGVAILGAFMVTNGSMSVGLLATFLTYANQYTKPFNEITGVFAEMQTALSAGSRVYDVIDREDEISDAHLPDAPAFYGDVTAQDVSFSYTEKPLIENFNLNVKSGMRVAVVGPTGSGKTTLINLLMRFYDTDKGVIAYDGAGVKTVKRKSLRSQIGMVLQDSWLFHASIKDNIAYGKPDADMDEIIAAAKKAHIHNFIISLDKGYETIIDNTDTLISGGQKQLLMIARIMLTSPPILILDEATSNIDTRTEILIQSSFKEIMQGRTTFIVAHRLSTIIDADLILVMNKGQIIEQGTHQALLEKGGFYSNLYNSQFAPVSQSAKI